MTNYWLRLLGLLARLLVIGGVFWLGYRKIWLPKTLPASRPRPAHSYAESCKRIREMSALDGPEIKSLCRTRFLDTGDRAPVAVVLLHGYSSSPHQYHILARQFHEQGANVLVPRYPYHGYVSRTYADFWRMPLEDVLDTVTEAVDIAQGLGDKVVVVGLSFGGALAAWLAQHRADIDRAVIVSPALGFRAVAGWLRMPSAAVGRYAPSHFTWWDAERKDAGGVYHAYAGWHSRGAVEMMRLGMWIDSRARIEPPAAQSVIVAVNPADRLLDLAPIFDLASAWQKQNGAVEMYVFPESWKLRHDCIEPDAENARVDLVYPVVLALAAGHIPEPEPA